MQRLARLACGEDIRTCLITSGSWPPPWRWRPAWLWPGRVPGADVVPPAGTWAEIFNPNLHANGITLCADDPNGSTAHFQALQLWRCHGYASNGIP